MNTLFSLLYGDSGIPFSMGLEKPPNQTSSSLVVPDAVPILPLRGLVVYPETAVPLTVGQARSIKLIEDVMPHDRLVGLVACKDPDLENPEPDDLFDTGTLAEVQRMYRAPDGTIRLLVQGIYRFRLSEFVQFDPYLKARIVHAPEVEESGIELEALARNARDQFSHISDLMPGIPRELVNSILQIEDPKQTVYTISNFQRIELEDSQKILSLDSISDKLLHLVGILVREVEVLELGQKIQNQARSEIDKMQREYFLREQMKAIQQELGESDEQTVDIAEFRQKIILGRLLPEAEKQANRELDRLSRLPVASAEYGVIRTYLDWLVSLPWSTSTVDNMDINHARRILDNDHYGLSDVKQRILEFLAVRKLREDRKTELESYKTTDFIRKEREGVILCFIGPPGVGKTSLGQSIARALGRKFIRISLGGVRDEAEIRGHRRTYIGALPGRIIQSIRRVESHNPIFMLDEIDKLSFDFHGDPASALLEVLDPEQNREFRDHYLEVAFDLSPVMFITTANQTETIPAPLLDRMEVIQISGYTEAEKIQIARNYLVPRQLRENGLLPDEYAFTQDALQLIVRKYTREAGVRGFEREIGSICRKLATDLAEAKSNDPIITPDMVQKYLGHEKVTTSDELLTRTDQAGVAIGLAWTPTGGDVLFIESTSMPGTHAFQITGSVGKVMEESARAALSYIRSKAEKLNIPSNYFQDREIHLHIPAGAQPKDGPSAGVTIATSLFSLITNMPVRSTIGMTGEITLKGKVLPVGGIKEKVLAAHRAGLSTVILPKLNATDIENIPKDVIAAIHFVFVESVDEVFELATDSSHQGNYPLKD